MKKLENTKTKTAKIAVALLALLLLSTMAIILSSSTNLAEAADYGDIMQYEWPQRGYDEGFTRFNPGPAPNTPNLLWQTNLGQIYTVFNGKAFITRGSTLYALDAFTGQEDWRTTMPFPSSSGPTKIDDTYMFVDHGAGYASDGGVTIFRISDGAYVSNVNMTSGSVVGWNQPGGGSYYPGGYSSELKMKYRVAFNTVTNESTVIAADLSDPQNPTVAWTYVTDVTSEIMCCGEGKVFIGAYSGYRMYALDGMDGTLLWESFKDGIVGYCATYYDGMVYHGGGTKVLTAFDAADGHIVWEASLDDLFWFPHGGVAANGRIYKHAVGEGVRPDGTPMGYLVSWDAKTGELLWKAETHYMGGYWDECMADGKLYAMINDNPNWAGSSPLPNTWGCFDALTGEKLWEVTASQVSNFIVAYGNLYAGTNVIGSAEPVDWSYWRGDIDHPGVALDQAGPMDISYPKWIFETDGPVTSSPAIVSGKVYVGSYDQNIYCLDAYTGESVWTFPTEDDFCSSVAVSGGRVFTGPDDGYIYCIEANTGDEIWKTDIYAGKVPAVQFEVATWEVRSSPIVVGSSLYVGALNGKVYCLSTSDGKVKWSYQTGGQIGGSPAYADGLVYIASTDRNLYAFDASNGSVEWTWTTPKTGRGSRTMFFVGTPTIADGKLFIGGGGRSLSGGPRGPILVCLDASTGAEIYVVGTDPDGNSNQPWCPTYFEGVLYAEAHMSAVAFNASDGSEIWSQWLGHQVTSSALYVDDISGGKVYVGCDSYSLTCFNATDGTPLSWFTADAQIVSSPAVYDGMIYVGSSDGNVYCFSGTPMVSTDIWASPSKSGSMWNNETLTIQGKVSAAVTYTRPLDDTVEELFPGLPDAVVKASLTKPDGTDVALETTTDNMGYFSFSYSPTDAGDWGWVVYYEGEAKPWITYDQAYGDWTPISVNSPTPSGGSTEPPPPAALPMEVIYVVLAVVIIVVVAFIAYFFLKRK